MNSRQQVYDTLYLKTCQLKNPNSRPPCPGRGELRTFSSSKAKTESEMVLELLQNPDLSVDVLCLKARAIDCAVTNLASGIRSA